MPVGRVFTVPQAAAYLGVHPNTIKLAVHANRLEGERDTLHQGGRWLFTKEQLDAYQERKLVRSIYTPERPSPG